MSLDDPNILLKNPGRSFVASFECIVDWAVESNRCAIRGSEYCLTGLVLRDFMNMGIGLTCFEVRLDAACALLFDGIGASHPTVSPFFFLTGWLLEDALLFLR